jgi:hypothetical protein
MKSLIAATVGMKKSTPSMPNFFLSNSETTNVTFLLIFIFFNVINI